MDTLDLLFVLYKYNVYFQRDQKKFTELKQNKIKRLFKEIDNELLEPKKTLCDILNMDELESYVFNISFPNNFEYIQRLIKKNNFNNNSEKLISLFKQLFQCFGTIFETNINFNQEDFLNKAIKSYETKTTLNKDKYDNDDYTILNLEEHKKNLDILGLPYFEK